MRRIWLRLTWIPASLAAWASALSVHWAEPSSSRATMVPSACVSKCPGGACMTKTRMRLRSCSVNLALRPDPGRMPSKAGPLGIEAHHLRMAAQLGGDLIGRLASPAREHHLGVKFPISGRVMALGQLAHHAFFLHI